MQFLSPYIFYFLLCIPLFLFLLYRTRSKRSMVFSGFKELQAVYKSDSRWAFFQIIVIIGIFFLYITLLAGPYIKGVEEDEEKNGIDIKIVFDVSYSMAATDLSPNRLEVAKKVLSDFVSGLKTDRVGLVLFAGIPFTSSPLTFDYTFVRDFISQISLDTIRQDVFMLQGTALGDGMLIGAKAFPPDTKRQKVMILMTDGEANRGIDPLVALKLLKEQGIKTYTIGVGGLEKTSVETTDILGNPVKIEIGGIDEKTLQKIASETGGKYYRATSEDTLQNIFKEIGSLEKSKIVEKKEETKKEFYDPFIIILSLFLLIFVFLRFKNIPL